MNIFDNHMINMKKLKNLIKEPNTLFEKSKSQGEFWDDEHISKQMLEAHLNPSWDAASRKKETIEKTCEWITSKLDVNQNNRLIDLGCGPGLYSSLLSRKGFEVTGIDYSKRSIEYVKKEAVNNNQQIKYMYQNYLEIDYTEEFDVALLIYCDFGALTNDDRDTLLQKIHRALKKDGYFIFDVCTTNNKDLTSIYKDWGVHPDGGFWSGDSYIELIDKVYDKNEEVSLRRHVIVKDDGEAKVINLWEQCYTPEKITDLLETSGFEVIEIYGNLTGGKYEETAEIMGIMAKKVKKV